MKGNNNDLEMLVKENDNDSKIEDKNKVTPASEQRILLKSLPKTPFESQGFQTLLS